MKSAWERVKGVSKATTNNREARHTTMMELGKDRSVSFGVTTIKLNERKSGSTNHVGCHRFVCSSRNHLCWWEGVPWKERDGCGGAWVCEKRATEETYFYLFFLMKKKKKKGFSLFKYEEFKSVKWIKSLRITFSG